MIWQNRSCSTAHTTVYIHTYVYREAVNRAWGIKAEKKIHGGVVARQSDGEVVGWGGGGHEERD